MQSPSSLRPEHGRINALLSVADAAALIESGAVLSLAGRPAALAALPGGSWIGGSTPYFMTEAGGVIVDDTQLFVTDFSGMRQARIACYGPDSLERISEDAPDNGFALTIIPAESECHRRFATDAPSYPYAFLKPTVGWIAGTDLAEPDAHAYVWDGRTGERHANRAVVLHVALPEDALVLPGIVNPFLPDQGDVIRFEKTGFAPAHCLVNGEPMRFADYVRARGREDCRLPLVGDFAGAYANVSLRTVEGDDVTLYAPVFPDVDYRFAAPIGDYAESFRALLSGMTHDDTLWSCNCVLNFLFGELEGKAIGGVAGPVTFGEIAYQLVNQTLVHVRSV